jgi:hypothetical protein
MWLDSACEKGLCGRIMGADRPDCRPAARRGARARANLEDPAAEPASIPLVQSSQFKLGPLSI